MPNPNIIPLRDRTPGEFSGGRTNLLPFPAPNAAFIAEVRAIYRGFLNKNPTQDADQREEAAQREANEFLARLIHDVRVADHWTAQNPDGYVPPLPESCFVSPGTGPRSKKHR